MAVAVAVALAVAVAVAVAVGDKPGIAGETNHKAGVATVKYYKLKNSLKTLEYTFYTS